MNPKLFLLLTSVVLLLQAKNPSVPEDKGQRTFNFTYTLSIPEIPEDAEIVEVFLPLPISNKQQEISNLKIESLYSYAVREDPDYKNKFLYLKIRQYIPEKLDVSISFDVKRFVVTEKKYDTLTGNIERDRKSVV